MKKDNAAMAMWHDAGGGEKSILKDYSEWANKSSELQNLLTGYNQHGVVEKQRKHNQNGHVKVSQNHYITKDGVAVQHGSITNLSTSAGKGMSGSVYNRYTREISKEVWAQAISPLYHAVANSFVVPRYLRTLCLVWRSCNTPCSAE